MTGKHELVEKYVSLIEDNISDINTSRSSDGKKWVYDDLPRSDVSDYPRIGVIGSDGENESHELGYSNDRLSVNVNVYIYVKKGMKYDVDGEVLRDRQILDRLSKDVRDLVRDDSTKQELCDMGVFYVILQAENTPENQTVIIRQLVFRNRLIR